MAITVGDRAFLRYLAREFAALKAVAYLLMERAGGYLTERVLLRDASNAAIRALARSHPRA